MELVDEVPLHVSPDPAGQSATVLQTSLCIAPLVVHLLRHALPSGCDDPDVPQQTRPAPQSSPKHVTAFAAVHADRLWHERVGAVPTALRVAQHTWGATQ